MPAMGIGGGNAIYMSGMCFTLHAIISPLHLYEHPGKDVHMWRKRENMDTYAVIRTVESILATNVVTYAPARLPHC